MKRAFLAALTTVFLAGLAPASPPEQLHCPKTPYSCCHYWFPAYYELRACINGPNRYIYPVDNYPCMPPMFRSVNFRCQPVPPAVLVGERLQVPPPPTPLQSPPIGSAVRTER